MSEAVSGLQVGDALFVVVHARLFRGRAARIFDREGVVQVRTKAARLVADKWNHLSFRLSDCRGDWKRETRLIPTPENCRRCKREAAPDPALQAHLTLRLKMAQRTRREAGMD